MAFELPDLPYSNDALSPNISAETLSIHHGKHHAGYVKKLNAAAESDSSIQGKSLEDLIRNRSGKVFNLAAQIWNHTFYWHSMSPSGGGEPNGKVAELITRDFGSFDDFKSEFESKASGHFGSGWAWLVQNDAGKLEIVDTHDAGNPMTDGKKPVLTCDVWEHAYYVDYRNARGDYLAKWWNVVNWDHANAQLG